MSTGIGTSILTEAEKLINGRRSQDYGSAKETLDPAAPLVRSSRQQSQAQQVVLCMIQLKISRVMQMPGHPGVLGRHRRIRWAC